MNGTIVSRRWVLGGVAVSTTQLYTTAAAGTLAYEMAARGLGGDPTDDFDALSISKPGPTGGLPALTLSAAIHRGEGSTVSLLGLPAGATVNGTYPGMTLTGTQLSGTPTARSALLSYTTAGGLTRDTLLFAPKTGARKMFVGMGIEGLSRYSPNYAFIDLFKLGQWANLPASVDANGMPLTLGLDGNGMTGASMLLPIDSGVTTPVKYRIVTDGDLDIQLIAFRTEGKPASYGFHANATKEGADYVFTYTGGGVPDVNFYFVFRRIGSKKPTYCHLIRDEDRGRFAAGKSFRAGFLAEIGKFQWVRFMNWHGGNFTDAPSRNRDRLTYNDGGQVPFELIAELCIEAKTGCWPNLHHQLTTADLLNYYVPLFDAIRAAGQNVFPELSNEVWNLNFPQNAVSAQKARNAGYTGQHAATWWVGHMTAEMARATRGRGYRWLVGVQSVNQPFLSGILDLGIASVSGSQPRDFFGWHCSWYSGGTLSQNYDLAPGLGEKMDGWVATNNNDAAFDNLLNYKDPRPGYRTNSTEDNQLYYAQAKTIADRRGLKLFGYEGQIDLNSLPNARHRDTYDPFFFKMVAHPLANGAATQMMETCEDAGFYGVAWFDYGSQPKDSEFGYYGMKVPMQALNAALAWQAALSVVEDRPVSTISTAGLRYFRLRSYVVAGSATAIAAGGPKPMLSEVRFKTADGSAISLANVVTSGDQDNPNEGTNRLIDGNLATSWVGAAGKVNDVIFDFGAGAAIWPASIEMQDRSDNVTAAPGDFDWSGSADGVTWQPLGGTHPGNPFYRPSYFYGSYGDTHLVVVTPAYHQ